ncbi:MAG: hypothetical protein Tsb0013_02670 [Phycisphaerales bacterium]
MRNTLRAGFTLVEILIVVVILGILAAIVVPQFTNASNEAVKGALESQLQTINSQVELYRVRNNGAAPTLAAGEANDGWGDMVGGEYLKEIPINGYTGSGAVDAGTEADALAGTRDTAQGWVFDSTTNSIFAMAFDASNGLLAHEDGFGGAGN